MEVGYPLPSFRLAPESGDRMWIPTFGGVTGEATGMTGGLCVDNLAD